jgi:hypothetical protein
MRHTQTYPYVTSPSIARAHTSASPFCKERAIEQSERSEALAQVSPLVDHRGDNPRRGHHPLPLGDSCSHVTLGFGGSRA